MYFEHDKHDWSHIFERWIKIFLICDIIELTMKAIFKKYQYPIIFWTSFELFLFVVMVQLEHLELVVMLSLLFFIPIIIPSQIHDYVFEKYFVQKKFLTYGILTLLIIGFFGYTIDLLEKAVYPQMNSSTYGSIAICMLIYIGVKYLVIGSKQKFKLNELEAKQALAELELLKSQLNPHFLFNSLNSIYSLTLKNSPKSSEAVMLLSDLMRYILESSKKKSVPLKEELTFIENYIEFEKLRLGNNFTTSYMITGDTANLYIAPMILITFVENVFKHGVSTNISNNIHEINIEINKNKMNFVCLNNIVLKNNELEKKENQTGIANVKRRLELIYPNQHTLTIEKINGKFQINLAVNLNS